jgi:outer membrane protein TolC
MNRRLIPWLLASLCGLCAPAAHALGLLDAYALAVRLLGAYSQALLAQERIELSQAQRRAYAERLQLNQRLLEGAEGTRTDVLETQARLSLALAEEIEARDLQDSALRDLADVWHAYLLARVQLRFYAGLLNEQDLQQLAGYFRPVR